MKTLLIALLGALLPSGRPAWPASDARPPAVAGRFYPADPGQLSRAVRGFLADALPPSGQRPLALIAPHAGYVFSGQIAADAYRQAADFPVDLVVILGTNHTTAGFDGISVYQGSGYRTPLGVAAVDGPVAAELLRVDPKVVYQAQVHTGEHSVEVQVPFVQTAFPGARIVGVVVGTADPDLTERFGEALATAVRGRQALIVASTDLSHYPSQPDAAQVDRQTLRAFASLDGAAVAAAAERLMGSGTRGLSTCACGEGAVLVALAAARHLGAMRAIAVSYANSGDTVFGEPGRAVGYGAMAFTAGPGPSDLRALEPPLPTGPAPLTAADQDYLLGLARAAIERYLDSGVVPLPRPKAPALAQNRGAFVTLKKRGELRGCIGHMAEDTPLALTVARMALQAAFRDTRFQPVRGDELHQLRVEISALTPFARVAGPGSIAVGHDGVLLEKGGARAVFLPQVAPEQGWARDEMLDHLCQKAGMPTGCWQGGATFYTFRAEVFGEGEGG